MRNDGRGKRRAGVPLGSRFLIARAKALVHHPLFFSLTFGAIASMLLGAVIFYLLENGVSPGTNFLDSLWWSVQTITTVGYGDIAPRSLLGRFFGMGLMIFGTALFSAFTALFATVLLEPEISEVENEVRALEKNVKAE